eukprot:5899145-Prorocentrum_lima.AAC.1
MSARICQTSVCTEQLHQLIEVAEEDFLQHCMSTVTACNLSHRSERRTAVNTSRCSHLLFFHCIMLVVRLTALTIIQTGQ